MLCAADYIFNFLSAFNSLQLMKKFEEEDENGGDGAGLTVQNVSIATS